jgi:hypothetical protein
MNRRLLSVLIALFAGLVAAPAHEDAFPRPEPGPPANSASRRAAQAWLDLFLELVVVAPSELQPDTIRQSWAVFDGWLRHPAEPATEADPRLLGDCAGHYARLRALHPVLSVAWDAESASRLGSEDPLHLTRGLESIVLVEITNRTPRSVELSAVFEGVAGAPKSPVVIVAGEERVMWARLKVDQGDATQATLRLTATGAASQAREISVPVQVSEPARLKGRLLEGSTGALFPGRLHIRAADGLLRRDPRFGTNDTLSSKPLLNFVFAGRGASHTLPFCYSDGRFDLLLPPGETQLTLERGFEHPIVSTNLLLKPGETREITLSSQRFLDMKALGWVSGDTHIHWAKNSWDVDEDIDLLALVQRAEDLRVANNLTLKHHTTNQNFIAPTQFPMGPVPGRCSDDWHIQMAEEYRNEEFYGHLIFLNLQRLIEPISTGFMGGPPFHDYPPNRSAILEARAQGGISIEAHGLGRNNDVPVNVSQALTDSLDQIEAEDYYRFLECGFRLPLSNGSDHPARIAGCARVYVKTEIPFSYQRWIDGIRSNRTFTTSGPLLFLDVNGHDIGDVLDVKPATPLRIKARAVSRFPLGTLQIVSNGKVVAEKQTQDRDVEVSLDIPAGESRWIVARCSQNPQFAPLSGPEVNPNAAHTSAIYVNMDGRPRFVAAAAEEWIRRMTRHADDLEKNGRFANAAQREEAVSHVRSGIEAYRELITTQGRSRPLAPASKQKAGGRTPAAAQPEPATKAAQNDIRLTPIMVDKPVHRRAGMVEGQDLSRVAFLMQAPWMTAPIELRFPEVLRSSSGFHFLDNYSSSITPLAEWDKFPEWRRDPVTGRLHYDFATPDGLRLIGSATPVGDEVHLEFTVVNHRPQAITRVEANCCLAFNDCPELNAKWDPSIIHAVLDGQWTSFDRVTPTAEQIGRKPWFLSLREEAAKTTDLPRVSPTWWMIDQHHTENLMGAVTRDRKWLVGYTWSVEPIGLMSNGGNPCLHTGMGFSPEIPPGKSFTWRGKVYLVTNNPAELIQRYHADQEAWRKPAAAKAGRVKLSIQEATNTQLVPSRIHLQDATGQPVKPSAQPFWHDHFVCTGEAELELAPGDYRFAIERGPEYQAATGEFKVAAAEWLSLTNRLRRIADLATEGWWSGDLHVHRDPAQAELLLGAEDLHVAQFTTWWNQQNVWAGQPLPEHPLRQFRSSRFVHIMAGEDEREGGALLYFNLGKPSDITRATRHHPHSLAFAKQIRQQPEAWIDIEKPFWWDVPAWLAAGVGDSIGIANNHQQRNGMLDNEAWGKQRDRERLPGPHGNGLWSQELYYRVLNAGFRLPPSAGSASGVLPNPVGYNRVYVHTDGDLTWGKWWNGLRAGQVFVSNGPLLRCRAGGQLPGHVFKSADSNGIEIELEARLSSRDPVNQIEIIQNGEVVRRVPVTPNDPVQRLGKLRVSESGWFLLRAIADVPQTFRFASTGPFYVEIGIQKQRISKASAGFFLDWTRDRIAQLKLPDAQQQAEVLQPWRETEQFWLTRLAQANAP